MFKFNLNQIQTNSIGLSLTQAVGGGQASRFRSGAKGQRPRPKEPIAEVGFLGKGQLAPLHQLRGLRSAVSSLSGARGGAPVAKRFSCILEAPYGPSWNLLGVKFGGRHAPLPTPLKSAYGVKDERGVRLDLE